MRKSRHRGHRCAFADIRPEQSDLDLQARDEGWARSNVDRGFRLEHREYDRERIEGFAYDIGAVLIRSADAPDESDLTTVLNRWGVRPGLFAYPWDSDDPR
ncbi:hypothetical protein ACIQPS_33320 [Streptomyces sp. NPDC091290]|uniref:hypothetical protein n=1 Tax=Streptomyces sp. NPDC091290 TaxID=3365990 RepID=UPI00381BA780